MNRKELLGFEVGQVNWKELLGKSVFTTEVAILRDIQLMA